VSLDEERERLEHALNTGQVEMLGEPGVRPASAEFLTRLDELPPSARRLALAKACALPWKDRIDELPDCYRWELRRAIDDWREDRAAYPNADTTLARIFEDVPEPISAVLLRQLVDRTPNHRHSTLIFALVCSWPGGPTPVLTGAPEAPRWLVRERAYTQWTSMDEFRAWKDAGWIE
jgi:hypothetical protein